MSQSTPVGRRFAKDVDRLGLIVAFSTVADQLSFANAAKKLDSSSATISRKVALLEQELGVRLLNRTTRSVALTDEGQIYHGHCLSILQEWENADNVLSSLQRGEPHGMLRLSLPVAFGQLHMTGLIAEFMQAFPKVSVDAEFSDRFVDIIGDHFDAVIRIGSLPDSTIVARKLADSRRRLVASPAYLERRGAPAHPQDLATHSCVRYVHYRSSHTTWRLTRGEEDVSVPVTGAFRCDNSEAVCKMALHGQAIGIVPDYISYDHLRRGKLVQVLPDWQLDPASGIYLCYPSARYLAPKVRQFADFVVLRVRLLEWCSLADGRG